MNKNRITEIKEREILKEKIIELLKKSKDQNKPIAITINGEWGIGKTYLWKNRLAPLIKDKFRKNPIYTSVFGKKDEQAIIEDLVAQFLSAEKQKTNPIRNIINGILSFLSMHFGVKINVNVDFLFKMLKKEHMENTIVCIDEFERLSDKIQAQDILGLISELKEHKGCCVIAICTMTLSSLLMRHRMNKKEKYLMLIVKKFLTEFLTFLLMQKNKLK
ncbi:P-loop NTPase fold protein [Helicobacter pylori]